MRLFELTGYKGHPVYQAGQKIKTSDETGDTRYDRKTMKDFVKSMKNEGWDEIGHGGFAVVFAHPNYPYVVKVFHNDNAYRHYFQYVKRNQNNPHVPKVRGGIITLNDRSHAVRLERLEPLSGPTDPILKKYIDPTLDPYIENLDNEQNYTFLMRKWPELYHAMLDADMMGGRVDIKYDNVMKRGNTLVLSDPVASTGAS